MRNSKEKTKNSSGNTSGDPSELEDWFADRPKWLQDAARRIIQKGQIDEDDLKQLVSICKAEAGIYDSNSQSLKPRGVVQGSLRDIPKQGTLRLKSIFELNGINALCPRKPLVFADERLTVVYGQNGSGKSGYVRALKHVCGQQDAGALLGNVFSASNGEQSCKFKYLIDGVDREAQWVFSNGPVSELRAIQVYDSQCAAIYVNEEKETVYEPFVLSLFTLLTGVCGRVDRNLEKEIELKVSTKAELPIEPFSTQSALWYKRLSDTTTDLEVSERCQWSDELEAELTTLNQRILETNPAEKAKKLRAQKLRVENLYKELAQWNEKLSDENCETYLGVVRDANAKRHAADSDAAIVFANAPLGGVASKSWKLLWDQARAYSEAVAYPGLPFPNTEADARCVLCQQPLGSEGRLRFISFESFVRGGLESEATDAAERVRQSYENLSGIAPDEKLNLRMDSIGSTLEAERARLNAFCSALEARKVALLSVSHVLQLPVAPCDDDIRFLIDRCKAIEVETAALDQDTKGENRPALDARQKELIAQKWLFQQRTSVQREIRRLREIRSIENARKLANTYALSFKKSVLADSLITKAYLERFQTEMADLGAGQIKVKLVKTRAERGHVFHRVQLDNPKKAAGTSEVLSEGEFRMVSLAAFLADVEARKDGAPFVFDDPISEFKGRQIKVS